VLSIEIVKCNKKAVISALTFVEVKMAVNRYDHRRGGIFFDRIPNF
jgi:hypothetical protein